MIYFFPPLPVAEWKRPVSSMHHWIHAERKSSGVCTVSDNRDSGWADWASEPVVSMRGLSCFYFVYMHVNDASVSALSIRYQQILHRNIVYLATIADASPDNFPPATHVGTPHWQPLSYWCATCDWPKYCCLFSVHTQRALGLHSSCERSRRNMMTDLHHHCSRKVLFIFLI